MKKVCLTLIIFFGLLMNAFGQTKVKTSVEIINEFWNLVLTDKIEDALKFCDAKRFKNYDLAKVELELIKIKETKITNILRENIGEDVEALHVNVKDKSGDQYVYTFYIYKKTAGEDWKIVDFFRRTSKPRIILPKLQDMPVNFNLDCPKCI